MAGSTPLGDPSPPKPEILKPEHRDTASRNDLAVAADGKLRWLNSVKFPAPCRSCGVYLAVGRSAWWSPSTKELVCLKCGPSRRSTNPPSHPEAAKDARSTTDDPAQDRWQRLVAYLRDCVTAEAAGELVRYEDATAAGRSLISMRNLSSAAQPTPSWSVKGWRGSTRHCRQVAHCDTAGRSPSCLIVGASCRWCHYS